MATVTASLLNVRANAGTSYRINQTLKKGTKITIIEEKNGFGKLNNGNGWVSLKYIKKV
jgi:N-acetylmuramoyl-L-alanine amidase